MKYQRGVSLSMLLVSGALLFIISLLAMKSMPAWIEYGKIKKSITTIATDPSMRDAEVNAIRVAYVKRMQVENIEAVKPDDLDISKEQGELTISFAYEARVPLFANVSLIFEFEGSSSTP